MKQYLGPRSEPDFVWLSKVLHTEPSLLHSIIGKSSPLIQLEKGILRKLRASGRFYYAQFPAALELYSLVRFLKPEHIVESGVSSGVSSAHMLLGLHENKSGVLHSIDLPVIQEGPKRERGQPSWAIPPNHTSGWAVPNTLKKDWDLRLGPSEELLPKLLRRLTKVDIFIHDSPHTARHLAFELNVIRPNLHKGSVVIADNTNWPSKPFEKFASSIQAQVYYRKQSSLAGLQSPSHSFSADRSRARAGSTHEDHAA